MHADAGGVRGQGRVLMESNQQMNSGDISEAAEDVPARAEDICTITKHHW